MVSPSFRMSAYHSSLNYLNWTCLGGAVENDARVTLSESSPAPMIWSAGGHAENGLASPSLELLLSFASLAVELEAWLVPGSTTPELREAKRRRILLVPSESRKIFRAGKSKSRGLVVRMRANVCIKYSLVAVMATTLRLIRAVTMMRDIPHESNV